MEDDAVKQKKYAYQLRIEDQGQSVQTKMFRIAGR